MAVVKAVARSGISQPCKLAREVSLCDGARIVISPRRAYKSGTLLGISFSRYYGSSLVAVERYDLEPKLSAAVKELATDLIYSMIHECGDQAGLIDIRAHLDELVAQGQLTRCELQLV